jgi:hypothetical protein
MNSIHQPRCVFLDAKCHPNYFLLNWEGWDQGDVVLPTMLHRRALRTLTFVLPLEREERITLESL